MSAFAPPGRSVIRTSRWNNLMLNNTCSDDERGSVLRPAPDHYTAFRQGARLLPGCSTLRPIALPLFCPVQTADNSTAKIRHHCSRVVA